VEKRLMQQGVAGSKLLKPRTLPLGIPSNQLLSANASCSNALVGAGAESRTLVCLGHTTNDDHRLIFLPLAPTPTLF
jgi:hypothetical protein